LKAIISTLSVCLLVACGSNEKKEDPAYYEATEGELINVPSEKRTHTLVIPPVSQALGAYDESLVEPPNLISNADADE
jgi:hypothetical protein